ncbi:DNA cytosine methyltransferase [Streptomyces chartreusis]|uniref:DNA cytosine methyltransferase n=1 Tax=Streptomyces chartreusis TaxID=1969 RepID=UPI0036588336
MGGYGLIDLFAGVGGLDIAARSLGVPAVGIEWDKDVCATRRAAGLATVEGDVRTFSPADFPHANVLAGGPPCQTFSIAGQGVGRRALEGVQHFARRMANREDVSVCLAGTDDPRTGLVLEPLRWVLAAVDAGRPYESVVLEQVPTALPVWETVGKVLLAEGYSVVHGVLNAEEFGVPQTRRRAVLIARRRGVAVLPQSTHRRYRKYVSGSGGDLALPQCVSMGEVLKRDRPFVLVSNYGSFGDPAARGRRTSDQPAPTVTGKINRNRVVTAEGIDLDRLTAAEAGCLQGFPSSHPWAGKGIFQQIGNAMPPRLAEHVLTAALALDHEPAPVRTGGVGRLFGR